MLTRALAKTKSRILNNNVCGSLMLVDRAADQSRGSPEVSAKSDSTTSGFTRILWLPLTEALQDTILDEDGQGQLYVWFKVDRFLRVSRVTIYFYVLEIPTIDCIVLKRMGRLMHEYEESYYSFRVVLDTV